eukprot:gene29799-7434_t
MVGNTNCRGLDGSAHPARLTQLGSQISEGLPLRFQLSGHWKHALKLLSRAPGEGVPDGSLLPSAQAQGQPHSKFCIVMFVFEWKEVMSKMENISIQDKQYFAKYHGYDLRIMRKEKQASMISTYFSKIMSVIENMDGSCDWIWCVDLDTIIMTPSISLDDLLDAAVQQGSHAVPQAVLQAQRWKTAADFYQKTGKTRSNPETDVSRGGREGETGKTRSNPETDVLRSS